MDLNTTNYQHLLETISSTYTQGQSRALQAVNNALTETYWQLGRHIVEFEQSGNLRAEYGKALLKQLSQDLKLRHGKGFSRSNLVRFRQLYISYPISAKPSHLLSWSHHVELLKIDDELERSFYEQQSIREKWSIPELKRQIASALFLRLADSKDKAGILQLSTQGQILEQPSDLLREPYILEFLKIPEPYQISETDLETLLCNHCNRSCSSWARVLRLLAGSTVSRLTTHIFVWTWFFTTESCVVLS